MPRITKVYTRTGDAGTTGLGGGQRVGKDSLRIEAYGTVDEANSAIGVVLASGVAERLAEMLRRIQNELFHLGSDLCVLEVDKKSTPVPKIEPKHVNSLEKDIDELQETLAPLTNFVLPGGAPAAAHLHMARTICRRAERICVALGHKEKIGPNVVPYLNRLSDLLFVMSRAENQAKGVAEPVWDSRA